MAIYTFEITELDGEYTADIVALFGEKGEKGDSGTTDYNALINKPDLTLKADKTYVDTQDTALQAAINTKQPTGDYATNTALTSGLDTKVDTSSLAPVATSGDYTDLTNKPTIPVITGKADITYVDSQDTSVASTAQSNLTAHTSNTSNPHSVTKAQVGLGDVDNTSDSAKPISAATQLALDAKANASDTVNLTGDQTVAGVKTFSSSPVVPTATTNTQAVNKAQMDTADALKVNKAGDTMTGPLESTNTSGVSYRQTRAAKNIGSGTSDAGNFSVYNFTNSFELFHAYSDGTGVSLGDSSNAPRLLHGTGFPNGVLSAPVGSTYIDKNVTNGASSWIKKSGTGNTGWVVSVGDTGWITPSSSLLVNTTSGAALVRRINAMVYLFFNNAVLNSGSGGVSIITAMPLGFRTRANERTIQGIGLNNNATLWQVVSVFDSVSYWCFSSTAGGNTSVRPSTGIQGTVQYVTDDAWPTTLP